MRLLTSLTLACLAIALGCRPAPPGAAGAGADGLRFPADLGPDRIDVRTYPRAHQETYALFLNRCSGCHTLARAVNAPVMDASSWRRYVSRMHLRQQSRTGQDLLTKEESKRLISFLAFDSRERKIKRPEEFSALQEDLNARFEREQGARAERARRSGQASARESAPYVGDR